MEQKIIVYPPILPIINRIKQDCPRVVSQQIKITESFRSRKTQEARYNQGRSKPGKIVTNAKPGQSWHEYGLAVDVCFLGPDPYLEGLKQSNEKRFTDAWNKFGELVIAYGFTWGGNFKLIKDMPHIEMTFGLTIHEAQELYRYGGVQGVWTYIDQMRGQSTSKEWPDFEKL